MRITDGEDVEHITSEQVEEIVASCNVALIEAKEAEPDVQVTPAWLSVYSPVYDLKADNWRFRLGTDVIYADISETKIAENALARGATFTEDAYQVRLQITTPIDPQGKRGEPQYKVLHVIRFVPAEPPMRQTTIFDD